jgi:hypothetical protein
MTARIVIILLLLGPLYSLQAQVLINEICPANGDINYDKTFYNFSGWIELYNAGSSSVNVSGYYLSDDLASPDKWRIPAGTSIAANAYLLIWCDDMNTGLHTNFTLDADGEDVVLSDGGLTHLNDVTFPKQHTNIAYGRITDAGSEWGYLITPTPNAKNASATASQRLASPDVSLKSGHYATAQTVHLSHGSANVQIRYTTDGSEPNAGSTKYISPIPVSVSMTIKAKAFSDGFLPSKTEVKTYFITSRNFTLPVVSLSTKPAFLWDNTIGIYADGTNGTTGNCMNQPRNWNQDWDRHAVLEIFDANGEKRFDQDVDIRIGGACSRNNPQKSFVIKARDKYGKNTIDEPLFSSKPIGSYGGFILRNSGNDFYSTMFRDALLQTLPRGQMDIDYLAYEPSIFFLNGEYWGIQNMREKIDADYFEANYGIDQDDIDIGEWNTAIWGSTDSYTNYLNTLQAMDRSSDEAFTLIDNNIDVQEFINYMVAEIYYCNTDWPGNNVKYWRQRSTNGKWRWVMWDMDFGFALYDGTSYATHTTLNFATEVNGPTWPNPPWSTLHLRLALDNPTFRTRFIQTMNSAMATTFKPERVIGIINQFADRIRAEIPFHLTRWNQSQDWNSEVQRLRNFATQRNAFMYEHVADFFGFENGTVNLSISTNAEGSGGFILNGVSSMESLSDGEYLRGLPYSVKAVPEPGFRFKSWKIQKANSESISLISRKSTWKYSDQGTLPSVFWADPAFDDATWAEGQAELGYGDGNEQTVVSYGADAGNKYITTYFRKSIMVADTTDFQLLTGSVQFDDGVIVYLNGSEVFRGNMPEGVVSNATLAGLTTPAEDAFTPFTIPKGTLKPGLNVIAVEIHQNGPGSTDISFDLDLTTVRLGDVVEFTTTDAAIDDVANSDVVMEATFEAIDYPDGIVINEISARPSSLLDESNEAEDWIELYNTSNEPIDLAGFYITDNLNMKTKFQIQAGSNNETVIGPGEYKIFWADEEPAEGPLHVNIKLSSDGESVGLYQMVEGSLIAMDEITFDAVEDEVSFSRIPNATGALTKTIKFTPMATNELSVPVAREENLETRINFYPNPTTGSVVVSTPFLLDHVSFINVNGKEVKHCSGIYSGSLVSLTDAAPGMYLVRINVNGEVVTKRIVKYN